MVKWSRILNPNSSNDRTIGEEVQARKPSVQVLVHSI